MKNKILPIFLAIFAIVACSQKSVNTDINVVDGQFVDADGQASYFIGTNLWYAGRLAATQEGMARLEKELDCLKGLGVTNLRVLAVEGEDLGNLKKALDQMEKRGMKAVLYLNNAWEWSYGFLDYLEAAGAGKQPRPSVEGYPAYMNAMTKFHSNKEAVALNHAYVKKAVEALKGSNAIFSWQISNEPRCFSGEAANKDAFVNYIQSTADLIKSLDPRHLVSTGNEGFMGCEEDMDLVKRVNEIKSVDYMTIHIWPYNWSWVKEDAIAHGVQNAIEATGKYIDQHVELAKELRKPMVIEEFGYPRDGFQFALGTPTTGRDALYAYVFDRVVKSQAQGGELAGCNFWGWGGYCQPSHTWWEEGDDYCNDPGQEQQGLNSVFVSDQSTVDVIKAATDKLSKNVSVRVDVQHNWIYDSSDRTLVVKTAGDPSAKVSVTMALVTDRSLMVQNDTVLVQSVTVSAGEDAGFDISGMEPGFYQVRLSFDSACGSGSFRTFNIGVDPELVESPLDVDPADFDAFWAENLRQLAAVPMDVKMEKMEDRSNELRTSYRVSMKSLGGQTMGGILCVPVKEGKYPAYIEYMGYGADVYPYDPSSAPDCIQFLVSVRGQGIFREDAARWIDRGLDSKENFYYRGAYCDVARAVDFVCGLPCTDPANVFTMGESQGGAFSIVAAALDKRVCAASAAVPFMGDFCDYWKIVWWPVWEVFETAEQQGLSREHVLDVMRWFDTKNFARRIEVPFIMGFGLQDPTCPPHTNFAAYNQVKGEKSYRVYPYCGHGIWQVKPWAEERDAFFASQIKK